MEVPVRRFGQYLRIRADVIPLAMLREHTSMDIQDAPAYRLAFLLQTRLNPSQLSLPSLPDGMLTINEPA
jgi:hypothetical protein